MSEDIETLNLESAAERIAKRFAVRPGFDLVSYMDVGLPTYRLNVQAILLERKSIPPVAEFVLKGVNAGLNTIDDIAGLLGLDVPAVQSVLVDLSRTDCVLLQAPLGGSRQHLTLSVKGKKVLQAAEMVAPRERGLPLWFDGLLRRPVSPRNVAILSARELKNANVKAIRPFPATPPTLMDLRLADVQRLMREMGGMRETQRDLLAVKAITQRDLLYLPAVMLVYRSNNGAEVQVGFAIDGRLSKEHEDAFSRAGGPRALGISQTIQQPLSVGERSPGQVAAAKITQAAKASAHKVVAAQAIVEELSSEQLTDEALQTDDSTRLRLTKALEELERHRREASDHGFRPLPVQEHAEHLQRALRESRNRLLIISPWINAEVVDDKFLKALMTLLQRNVSVYIGYGINAEQKPEPFRDRKVMETLKVWATKYANFRLVRLGDTHSKVLISDTAFCIVTSFNWLSFRGDPNRTFRDERGIIFTVGEKINEEFSYHLNMLTDSLQPQKGGSPSNTPPAKGARKHPGAR
jgi:hypothetical protein